MISLKRNFSSLSRVDASMASVLAACATLVIVVLILIVLFLVKESLPVLRSVSFMQFLTDESWHPTENLYGALPMLVASLAASFGAILLAGPLGIISAIFCRFYAPKWLARWYRRLLELLAGIPSVVFGFWGLTVLVPLIAMWQPPGASLFTGILILLLMILPTVALTSEAALASVPLLYLNGAAVLGLSRKATILGVALPAAKGGILMGILLATARALGETMAVVMVSGNVIQIPHSVFDPVRTLTANIALEMAYAAGNHRSALYICGLLLTLMIGVLAALSVRLSGGHNHA